MNLKGFLADTLSHALDLGIATPDDVVRHVTPDILAEHLPRPLWARLLTACMGAPQVDSQLVVETIGIPNLCEHVPVHIMWTCIAEVGVRSLGGEFVPAPVSATRAPAMPLTITPPPEPEERPAPTTSPRPRGPSIPPPVGGPTTQTSPAIANDLADVVASLEADDRAASPPTMSRSRTPTHQRFRQSSGAGRLASASNNSSRRPQAAAPAEPPRSHRRGATEVNEYEIETEVGKEDWKSTLAVEDEQLVDWSASEETQAGGDELGRKR